MISGQWWRPYTLTLTVSDGMNTSASEVVTVHVTNVNEAPTDLSLTHQAIRENSPVGSRVGVVSAVDPDAG